MTTSTIRVDSNLLQRIEAAKPSYLSTAGFFQLLAEQALTGLVDNLTLSPLTIPPYPTASKSSESLGDEGVKLKERQRLELIGGEGVLGEEINHPPTQAKRVDPALEAHSDLIRDFWRTKKGSKGERAWSLLQTGLKGIQSAYGDDVVREQLELAINGRWQSITLANYERFKPQPKPWEQEPANNHPANKVFTASDFEVPATNPVLQDLF